MIEKLLSRTLHDPNTGCFNWTKGKDKDGYGKIRYNNQHMRTHRVMYLLHYGVNPDKLLVCHKCDNPSCINPEHLFLGTPKTNMEDKVSKGRLKNQHMFKTHCKNGHEFNGENTEIQTYSGKKRRVCKICYVKAWKERNKKYAEMKKLIRNLNKDFSQ